MAFSPAIKKRLMIDSARRCCVCKRFKGVGVEVHHMNPKASGGDDSYENGIVLCFDCHCAAGHYNSEHPRGIKYSPEELKLQKKEWFETVSQTPFQLGDEMDDHKIICRYYVTSDRDTASKIFDFDKSSLVKVNNLLSTPVLLDEFKKLKSQYSSSVQDNETDGYSDEFYKSRADLISEYPEFNGRQSTPLNERILKDGKFIHPFARILLDAGASPEDVASINYFYEACGGSGWGVDYQARKAYFVFAQIINLGEDEIRVTSLETQAFELNSLTKNDVFEMSEVQSLYKINNIALSKDENITTFLGVIAGPIDYDPTSYQFETGPEIDKNVEGDTVERIIHNSEGLNSDFATCEKLYIPKTMSFFKNGHEVEISFEDFRPDTLFLISREWLCGSCPHLFGVEIETGVTQFIQTLFDNSEGENVLETINCSSYSKLIIAEFDNEVSEITSVTLDGVHVSLNKELNYGDSIELNVKSIDAISINGFYKAAIQSPKNSEQRRQKTSKFIAYEKELKSGLLSAELIRIRPHSSTVD